jgi:nucleoside-diphosphate-sugar epimerase
VAAALTDVGHEVRVLDALLPCVHPGGVPPFSGDPGFEFTRGDVRDAAAVGEALRGVTAVCHLAAMVGLGVDFEDGAQRRDFVHVRDVACATVTAVEAVAGSGVPAGPGTLRAYNVGSGAPRTVGELAAALADAAGGPRPVITGEYRLGDVRHVTASSERIRRELGWRAAVPFAAGIAEFAASPAGRA